MVLSEMPVATLWTNTSQGPHGTDREVEPREGSGPATTGVGTGGHNGSDALLPVTAAGSPSGLIPRPASPARPGDFS